MNPHFYRKFQFILSYLHLNFLELFKFLHQTSALLRESMVQVSFRGVLLWTLDLNDFEFLHAYHFFRELSDEFSQAVAIGL